MGKSPLIFRTIVLIVILAAFVASVVFLLMRPSPLRDSEDSFREKVVEKVERVAAQSIVYKFMTARIERDTKRAFQYLTERSIAALDQGEQSRVVLVNNFERYEIVDIKEFGDGSFQFMVKVFEGEIFFIEEMRVIKVLDSYFIDSIELAG